MNESAPILIVASFLGAMALTHHLIRCSVSSVRLRPEAARRRNALVLRLWETGVLSVCVLLGILVIIAYHVDDASPATWDAPVARICASWLTAYYLYHGLAIFRKKGYPRLLFLHHVLIGIAATTALVTKVGLVYFAVPAVCAASGIVRNNRWFSVWAPQLSIALRARTEVALYLLTECVPTAIGVAHFALVCGLAAIPATSVAFSLVPMIASALIAIYWGYCKIRASGGVKRRGLLHVLGG